MTNPYQPPELPDSQRPHYQLPTNSILTIVLGLGGAVIGFVIYSIVGNLEGWGFYTIRSILTGEDSMYAIKKHPADFWIMTGLFASFLLGGLFLGLWLARIMTRGL